MDMWTSIAVGIGLSAACGFRVFIPLFLASLAGLSGMLPLHADFAWLATYPALFALGSAALAEVMAYYIPWVDNLLDTVATPAAVLAGTAVSASVLGESLSPFARWALAVISGGGVAGLVQGGTVAARGASSATTGGAGNPVVSTTENVASVLTSILALFAPIIAVVGVAGLCFLVLRRLFRRRQANSS